MAQFGFRNRFEDAPVGVSVAERESVSTNPGSFVQRAIAGDEFLNGGFQSPMDALTAGPFGLRDAIKATVERQNLLRDQARQRLALTQQAIVGRQQQANIDRGNAEGAEAREFSDKTRGMKPSDMLNNDLFNPMNRQIVSQVRTAIDNYGQGVRESAIDSDARKMDILERVEKDPEAQRAMENAAKTRIILEEARAAKELEEIGGTTSDPVKFAGALGNVFPDRETRVALIDRYRGGDDEYRKNFTESMTKLGEISSQYASVTAAAQGAGLEVADPGEMATFRQAVAAAMAGSENGEIPTGMIVEMAEASARIQHLGAALAERKAKQDAALAQMKAVEESIDLKGKELSLEDKMAGTREISQLAEILDKLFESELASLRASYNVYPGDPWPNPEAPDVKALMEIKKKRDNWLRRAGDALEGRLNKKHFGDSMRKLGETFPGQPVGEEPRPAPQSEIETPADAIF